MPSGFGQYHFPHPATADHTLAGSPNPHGGIGTAALTAVQQLAAAAGHPLSLPSAGPRNAGATTGDPVPWIAFASGAILVALAWIASLRARPLRFTRREPSST